MLTARCTSAPVELANVVNSSRGLRVFGLVALFVALGVVASIAPHPSIEQILVLYPPLIAATQSAGLPNSDNPAQNTFFANQLNDPPPCTTGFLPADQRRSPTELDVPPTPPDLYCKVAPENPAAIRGARNLPCVEYPGKRAPTVQLCRDPAGYSPDLQNLLLPPG